MMHARYVPADNTTPTSAKQDALVVPSATSDTSQIPTAHGVRGALSGNIKMPWAKPVVTHVSLGDTKMKGAKMTVRIVPLGKYLHP